MNLNKRAMQYAKSNHYYCIGKIKKYLRLFDRKMNELHSNLGDSVCPECGGKNTYKEYSDSEYDSYAYMSCDDCGNDYDDYEFINKLEEIESYYYFDGIKMEVWAYDFKPPRDYNWFKKCDEEMDYWRRKIRSRSIRN